MLQKLILSVAIVLGAAAWADDIIPTVPWWTQPGFCPIAPGQEPVVVRSPRPQGFEPHPRLLPGDEPPTPAPSHGNKPGSVIPFPDHIYRDMRHTPVDPRRVVEMDPRRNRDADPRRNPPNPDPRRDPKVPGMPETGTPRPETGRPRQARAPLPLSNEGIWEEKPWFCWWEANRDAVMERIGKKRDFSSAGAPAALAAGPDKRQREAAVKVLMKATFSEHASLREAAALALGQLGEVTALDRLKELTKDPEIHVRGTAWMAIGLSSAPGAEEALLKAYPRKPFEGLGVVAGLAFLDKPTDKAWTTLEAIAKDCHCPEVRRMAIWAMRAHKQVEEHDFIRKLLMSRPPVEVASEGLLALGAFGNSADLDGLLDAATAGSANLPWQQTVVTATGGGYGTAYNQWTNGNAAYLPTAGTRNRNGTQTLPNGMTLGPDGKPVPPGWAPGMPVGGVTPPTYTPAGPQGYLQVAACLALGYPGATRALAAGDIRAENALVRNFAPYVDQGGAIFSGASIMSFAASASPDEMYILLDILEMTQDPANGPVHPKSTLRGYAALGIGIYLANGGPAVIPSRTSLLVQSGSDPNQAATVALPDHFDLNQILFQRYCNTQESQELRAACALSLGLAGDPGNAKRLLDGAEYVTARDTLLLGYVIEALGMLHEKALLNAAGPLLAGATTRIPVDSIAVRGLPGGSIIDPSDVPQGGPQLESILARRAALYGVMLLGDPKAGPLLAGAWGKERSTVQDAARAMATCKAAAAIDSLMDLVKREQNGSVEAAISLGFALDSGRPPKLTWLASGENYHQPQTDYGDKDAFGIMLRDYVRRGDFLLYSTPLGGKLVKPAPRGTTQPSAQGAAALPSTRPAAVQPQTPSTMPSQP